MDDKEVFESLKSIVSHDLDSCSADILSGGEAMSHFIGMDGNGETVFVAVFWENDQQKSQAVEAVKVLFAKHNIVAYALVSETWYMKLKKGEALLGQPSDYPHLRREALIAMLETSTTRMRITREITRDPINVEDEVEEILEFDSVSGQMTGLLPIRH